MILQFCLRRIILRRRPTTSGVFLCADSIMLYLLLDQTITSRDQFVFEAGRLIIQLIDVACSGNAKSPRPLSRFFKNKLLFFNKHISTLNIFASYNRCVRAPGVRMLEIVGICFLSSPFFSSGESTHPARFWRAGARSAQEICVSWRSVFSGVGKRQIRS